MQLCRIIYYSLAALHVSSDIFTHHQEHLNCITASGITHVQSLPAGIMGVLEYRSKHVEQPRNNKLSYTVAFCWSYAYIIPHIMMHGNMNSNNYLPCIKPNISLPWPQYFDAILPRHTDKPNYHDYTLYICYSF